MLRKRIVDMDIPMWKRTSTEVETANASVDDATVLNAPSTNEKNGRGLQRFTPYEIPKDWGIELVIAETDVYLGKKLVMRAGCSGPLQYHRRKEESFYLESGYAMVTTDIGGKLVRRPMKAGESYHVPCGAVHRVSAVTDCVFFETSVPVHNDRVNVEGDYGDDAA